MTPAARDLLQLLVDESDGAGGLYASARQLGEQLGRARETVQRALRELREADLVEVEGGRGRVPLVRLTCDGRGNLRARHTLDAAGDEYTPLRDEAAARRQRLEDWGRRGRGPDHLVAAGLHLLGRLDESQLDDRAREALHGCAPRATSGGHAP